MERRKYVLDMIASLIGGSKRVQTAEIIVERLQEEGFLVLGYGDADVERVVEAFSKCFHTTKTSKYDRFAANRLAKKYSPQAIVGIIQLLAQNNDVKYAPVVNNLTEMENKMPSILNFLRKQKGSEEIDV